MSEILQGFLSTMCTLSRLYGDARVLQAVMQDGEADVEACTELQELIANENYEALVGSCWGRLSARAKAAWEWPGGGRSGHNWRGEEGQLPGCVCVCMRG